ncbi:MAG TPA: Crp/Fnr family transcriptional regulator [Terracidiphilus sp.]|jgi:CRP-like cAMP-binding protein
MKPDAFEVGGKKNRGLPDRWNAAAIYGRGEERVHGKGDGLMRAEAKSRELQAVAAHPVSELLACPAAANTLLTAAAQTVTFDFGEVIFRQGSACAGLYLVIQGQLQRRTERLDTRVTLGGARPGDLVELAAALGDKQHTYSLVAQGTGSLLLFPQDALQKAFDSYPPLRMQLLEELAREVSRAYHACSITRGLRTRRSRLELN